LDNYLKGMVRVGDAKVVAKDLSTKLEKTFRINGAKISGKENIINQFTVVPRKLKYN